MNTAPLDAATRDRLYSEAAPWHLFITSMWAPGVPITTESDDPRELVALARSLAAALGGLMHLPEPHSALSGVPLGTTAVIVPQQLRDQWSDDRIALTFWPSTADALDVEAGLDWLAQWRVGDEPFADGTMDIRY